jgi:hypothetical protein
MIKCRQTGFHHLTTLSLSYLDQGGTRVTSHPTRGSRYRISTTSLRASGGDNTHCLIRMDMTVGAHARLIVYTRVLRCVSSLSDMGA